MKHSGYIALIAGYLLLIPVYSLAQNLKDLSMDAGLYFNSDNDAAFHFSVNYNRLFNQYFGVSAGAMFLSAPLDAAGWSNEEQTIHYYLDEKNVRHINIVLSVFYMRPFIRNTGMYGKGSVLFEPIPYQYLSIEKRTGNDWNLVPENHGKFQYSGFSPGTFAEAGLFYDFKKGDRGFRLFIGFGYGWYDIYAAFRRTTIDGQKLSMHIPRDNYYKRITIRLMGI
jgi:hypothetical protein